MRVALLPAAAAGFAPQLVFISARCGSWFCPTPGLRCASGGSWFCPTTGLHYASNGSWICPETGLHFVPATAAGFAPPLVFIVCQQRQLNLPRHWSSFLPAVAAGFAPQLDFICLDLASSLIHFKRCIMKCRLAMSFQDV